MLGSICLASAGFGAVIMAASIFQIHSNTICMHIEAPDATIFSWNVATLGREEVTNCFLIVFSIALSDRRRW